MKSRMWENCLYGSVRGRAGDCPVYSTRMHWIQYASRTDVTTRTTLSCAYVDGCDAVRMQRFIIFSGFHFSI